MKTIKSVCAAVFVASGIALIAWLSYDAAIVQETLGLGLSWTKLASLSSL